MSIMTFAQVVDTTISHHSSFFLGLPSQLDDHNLHANLQYSLPCKGTKKTEEPILLKVLNKVMGSFASERRSTFINEYFYSVATYLR